MNISTTLDTASAEIRKPDNPAGFFTRLVETMLLSRERSAMNQIARFDPAMAAQIRDAKAKS